MPTASSSLYGFQIDLAHTVTLAWQQRTTHLRPKTFMKPLRHCLAIALWTLVFVAFVVPVSFAQGSKRATEYDSIGDRDRDNPKARDEWFVRGRTAPEGESPAMLRFQAY